MDENIAAEDAVGFQGHDRPQQQAVSGSSFHTAAAPASQAAAPQVSFDRQELREIFDLYGRKVAAGEWRDYAMDFLKDRAVFSVFRRTAEFPLYRIEKNPKLARRQGAYSVIAPQGLILKRGHDLSQVLRVIDKPVRLVAD
ncbi:MAG: DUF2794 domain-containing protein [Alsobacter sp.]